MTGIDYHAHFMERAGLNLEKYKKHFEKGQVKFRRHDYLNDQFEQKFDVVTFGFEVSLDVLRARQDSLELGAHLLVPLSDTNDQG